MITQRSTFDIRDPHHQAVAVARLTSLGLSAPRSMLQEGREWYGRGHELVSENRGSMGMEAAAGITAALSPASDWNRRNIPALHEMGNLRRKDWADIASSRASGLADLDVRRAAGTATSRDRASRHPEITAMLRERAPHLNVSSDAQLLKAARMLPGRKQEHPLDVLTRETSPKTRAFYKGLIDPEHGRAELPIDFRMHDLITNTMLSGKAGRGIDIGTYRTASKGPTPYEHAEHIIASAGSAMREQGGRRMAGMQHPLKAQAMLWMRAKHWELNHPQAKRMQSGDPFVGPHRTGQAYTDEGGNLLAYPS